MASQLPLDILFSEILPKLPVKSLSMFKTVSKSFNTVISSSDFIRRHLCQCRFTENRLINVFGTRYTVGCYNLESLPCAPSATFNFYPKYDTVVGACNGLLCIKFNDHFLILNPLTRTCVYVPSTIQCSFVGFGYDEVTDDYKILVMSRIDHTRSTYVYSVNFKLWKLVHQILSDNMEAWPWGGSQSVLLDNHLLHWTVLSRDLPKRKICCFDLRTETWKDDVLLPSWYLNCDPYTCYLGVLDGCLFTTLRVLNECIQVWVMKEYGVQESWSKLISIPISLYGKNGVVPMAFRGTGSSELLVMECYVLSKPKLVWYNLESNATRDATGVTPSCYDYPYICHGSLVTLPGAKPFEPLYEPDRSNNVS